MEENIFKTFIFKNLIALPCVDGIDLAEILNHLSIL